MAIFTERTRLLAALLVVVSAVIIGCSVHVCHGAQEADLQAAGYYRRGGSMDDPDFDFPFPGPRHVVCNDGPCRTGPGRLRPYPFPRPLPYRQTPPAPPSPPLPPPQNKQIPPP
ncbi:uncharacterized protein LOC127777540 [Oryza glaberrima]|uniref:uncharacterized protein LOC127777540 n=1 Tax=Oryza glaberrima TaxID=4538 RepID=UPI00224C44A1|nr:uncharacterized protein LOC127777540 [Oryza glaberrima]